MFIEKEERLSRSDAPMRRSFGARPAQARRRGGAWHRPVRIVLYALLGVLAGLAALACAALLMDRPSTPALTPPAHLAAIGPAPGVSAPGALTPGAAAAAPTDPGTLAPVAALPPATKPAETTPAAPAPDPQVAMLQQQIREATDALAGLRNEAQRLQQGWANPPRAAPSVATPPPPATAAVAPLAPAPVGPAPASPEPADGWADAERTIHTLQPAPPARPADRAASKTAFAAAAPALPRARPAPAPRATEREAEPPTTASSYAAGAAGTASPAAAPADLPVAVAALPRPLVFLHYRGGSTSGLYAVAELARRLAASDFRYADTRSAPSGPASAVVRFFYPQDEAAAQQLAALLSGTGEPFTVQDATAHPGRFQPNQLDVWVGQ